MSSETFTRLPKECDPPAPSIMEGFLLCNGDETLAIVEPTGDTIAVLEAHRNVLHKETGIMEGQVDSTPTMKILLIYGKKCFFSTDRLS